MGRHNIHVQGLPGHKDGPRWSDPYHCEWGVVVGDRIRRLRRDRDLTLAEFARLVWKPEGGHYSGGYFSRVERGWASAPLYTYLAIAEVLDVQPGVLLGPDEAHKSVSAAEQVLLGLLRRGGVSPEDAITRVFELEEEEERGSAG